MSKKKKFRQIKVGIFLPVPLHDLLIQAVCSYYNMSRREVLSKAVDREHARRKHLLYFLLKTELQIESLEIAAICKTTRQNVSLAVSKMEAETNIYLQSASDCRHIRQLFETLRKEQNEWLTSHKNNTRH